MQPRKAIELNGIPWLLCLCILICSCLPVCADEMLLDDYKKGLSPKWTAKSFKGETFEILLFTHSYELFDPSRGLFTKS